MNEKRIARRTFFAGVGLAAAAGATAKFLAQTPLTEAVTAGEASDSDAYRLSEHVKKYYRTTTI